MPLSIFGKNKCFWLDSERMFVKLVLLDGKQGAMRVVTRQLGLTRPLSIFFSVGLVRDIVPPVIHEGDNSGNSTQL